MASFWRIPQKILPLAPVALFSTYAYCHLNPSLPPLTPKNQEIECIEKLALEAGMLPHMIGSIEKGERCLTSNYKLDKTNPTWLKFGSPPLSNGALYIKPLCSGEKRDIEHGKKRRKLSKRLILEINGLAERELLVTPLPIDAKREIFEYEVPPTVDGMAVPPHLVGTSMTHWNHVSGKLPHCFTDNKWNPVDYSPTTLRMLLRALWEVQQFGRQWLDAQKDREELTPFLTHEDRKLIGYDKLFQDIRSSLGLSYYTKKEFLAQVGNPESSLRQELYAKAKSQLEKIHLESASLARLFPIPQKATLDEIGSAFLSSQKVDWKTARVGQEKEWDDLSFEEILFLAEREKIWPQESLLLGRKIAQLKVAEDLTRDIVFQGATSTCSLLNQFYELENHYRHIESEAYQIVHQDAHPAQFLEETGTFTLLDLNNLSLDYPFADIANVYLFKIVRSYMRGNISEEKTLELIDAILIPEWVKGHEKNILSHTIASFWNHSMHLIACYNLDQRKTSTFNLLVTLERFLTDLEEKMSCETTYRKELLPKLVK